MTAGALPRAWHKMATEVDMSLNVLDCTWRAAALLALAALLDGAGAGPLGAASEEKRPRAREIGIAPGVFPPGPLNAITDVAGVRVGQVTLVEGDRIRTGVTAIVPHGENVFRDKVAGGVF